MQQIYTGLRCYQLTWLPLPFGIHKGQTIPRAFFDDPGFPTYLAASKTIKTNTNYGKELFRQAKLVASREQRILVPNAPRDAYEYLVLKDRRGILARVVTVKKGAPMPNEFDGMFTIGHRCAILNATAFKDYKEPYIGWKRMIKCLRVVLFPYKSEPTAQDFEGLFAVSTNFAPVKN